MKTFITSFVINYISMVLLYFVTGFTSNDDTDFFSRVLDVLSWKTPTNFGVFVFGFPASAALLAFAFTMIHRYWIHRKND
jgi:uncharacterized membrane protein